MLDFKTPHRQRGFGNIHTYIRSWRLPGKVKNARNPHRERGLGSDQRELCCRWNAKTLTGRGVSKRTRKESSWLLSMYVCMSVCLGTYIHTFIHTYIHTYIRSWRLPGKVKNARNPHRQRGLGSDQGELGCRWNSKTLTGRGVLKTYNIVNLAKNTVC